MNGSLLAVLGVIVLLAIVLILKMRTRRSKPEVEPKGEQSVPEVVAEATVAAEKPEAAESAVEAALVEMVEPEPGSAEVPPEKVAPESVVESVAAVGVEEESVREEVIAAEEDAEPVDEQTLAPIVEGQAEQRDEPPLVAAVPEVDEVVERPDVEVVETVDEPARESVEEESELESAEQPSVEQGEAPAVAVDLDSSEKPTETALLLVRLSMEEYGERLNDLEAQQRAALAEAIEQNDDQRRDQLQRELVIMNDRLALLADHYVEEMACSQQVLDTLARLQAQEPSPALTEAIAELQTGKTGAATAFLEGLSHQSHPLALQAAFLCGQLAECRVDLQKAMECYRQAVGREPDNPQYVRAAGLMARSLYKYKEALPWLESYVQLIAGDDRADAKVVALAQRELAYTYVLSGQYQKAGPLYKQSMTVLAQKLGQEHPEMAISWQQIGEFQETMGEYDKAVSLYKKALAILEKKRGPEHPALAGILRKLAALCVELELEPEAVPLYEQLVRIQEKALRSTHPQLAISYNNLAEAYRLQGRYAEAEACYLKTLRINEELHGGEHPGVAAILQELAKLCTSQRKTEEAQQYQERATAIFRKSVEAAEKKAGAEEALTLELS